MNANPADRGVMITGDAARRIGRAVAAYERGNRDIPAPPLYRLADDFEPLRLCKTVAAWDKGTTQTVEVWEEGTFPNETISTGQTIEARNKFANIASGKFCSIAFHANGGWYVVAAEC